MALYVRTANSSGLLTKIKKAIDDKKIDTWSYDKDGDFTHTPPQWRDRAWMRPYVRDAILVFGILKPMDVKLSTEYYGIYHGRFAEMLLNHFDTDFSLIETTAMPVKGFDIM